MTGTVAVVLHEPGAGGASRAALAPVDELARRGWRFTFWVPQPGPMADELRARGHRVAGTARHLRFSATALREPPGPAARLRSLPGYGRAFGAWLRQERPDAVHLNTLLTLPEGAIARALGFRTLLHVHEMLPTDARGRAAAVLARRCDSVVAVSEACGTALGRLGVAADVVRLGVPVREPEDAGGGASRTGGAPAGDGAIADAGRGGAARDGVVIGLLGTVSRRKGSDLFVDVAADVLARRPGVEARLVGPLAPGTEGAWARGVVDRAGTAGIAWSSVSDGAAELAGWDLLVLPTRADPFPLVVLEAMAAGVPVVAFAVDGVPEQLGGEAGTLVPRGDRDALLRAVLALVDDPARRRALGAAGRARVAARFSPVRHADGMDDAYGRVGNGVRRTPSSGPPDTLAL